MKKEVRKKIVLAVLVFALVAIGLLFLVFRNTEEEDKPVPVLTGQEVMEQSRDKEYRVKNKRITYTFGTDGVLTISGKGSTESFESLEKSQEYFLKELYKVHTGSYPKEDTQATLFMVVLDRITEIKVEEGVTGLGDSSLSPFFYVETVTLPESLQSAGEYVFFGTGQYAEEELVCFGLEGRTIVQTPTSFFTRADDTEGVLFASAGGSGNRSYSLRPAKERGTVPDTSLLVFSVSLGDDVEASLYENGVLYVSGSGSTYDFEHYSELEKYIMEQLYCVSRMETENKWFDMVTEIIIAETIERIGDNAMALYENIMVVFAGSPEELGKRAFYGCGSQNTGSTAWNITLDNTATAEDSFGNCNNRPDEKKN